MIMGKRLGGIFCLMMLISVLSMSFVLATTDYSHPQSGDDTTGMGTYTLTSGDLDDVEASDDTRYDSYSDWQFETYEDTEAIDFYDFDLSVPGGASIDSVTLNFEWHRDSVSIDGARIRVWDDSESSWHTYDLSLPAAGVDQYDSIDLSSHINSISDLENIEIRFQAHNGGGTLETDHDLVELEVDYTEGEPQDETYPECTIDYLEHKYSHNQYFFSSPVWVTETGKFFVYGDSTDDLSGIFNVQYNRTSPDTYLLWTDADPDDGGFSELEEEWRSDPNDESFIEGLHEVCCRAEDNAHNTAVGECEQFCIDLTPPSQVSNLEPQVQDCSNDGHYSASDCVTWTWDEAVDEPDCGEIDYYIVKLYYSNGSFITSENVYGTSKQFCNLQDGKDYYVEVKAVDKAGHMGGVVQSDEVIIDLTNPIVTITGPNPSIWYDPGFYVTETDVDVNLDKCYYRIKNDGSPYNPDWTLTACNSPVFIDVNSYCTIDGNCKVEKKATDKACRAGTDYEEYMVDTHEPVVSKTVGEPKIQGGEWMQYILDWFITDQTSILITCDDGQGSGVKAIYYRVNDGEWQTSPNPFTLNPDGVYHIEYYCVDNVDKISSHEEEWDKVDTLAPTTTKTYDGNQFLGYRIIPQFGLNVLMRFINSQTQIVLNAIDTEVGVDETYYQILVPSEEEPVCGEPVTDTLFSDNFNDGVILDNGWSGDYFEPCDSCSVPNDVHAIGIPFSYQGISAKLEDDVAIYHSVNTNGYSNIVLKYCRKTMSAEGSDRLKIGWKTGSSSTNWNNWNEVEAIKTDCWNCVEFSLGAGAENTNILIAFFMDNGEGDYGLIDNIEVTGDSEGSNGLCEWYGEDEEKWYETEEECEQENEDCEVTLWELKGEYMNTELCNYQDNGWCLYNEPITIPQDCDHKICYYSDDLLANKENVKCQVFSVDNEKPEITIYNPTDNEAEGLLRCDQSIVVEVWDEKSGVDESSVYAELYNESDDKVKGPVYLTKAVYKGINGGDIYEGIMDKQLPAGEYTLKVYASDNLGNGQIEEKEETLASGIYVEYLDPVSCVVDMQSGGQCSFTFHVCVRGDNAIKFWMDKLGENPGLITPDMLNAEIAKGEATAYVGLMNVSDAEELLLSSEKINGKTTFDLRLTLTSEITELIGTGIYDLDYFIESYDP